VVRDSFDANRLPAATRAAIARSFVPIIARFFMGDDTVTAADRQTFVHVTDSLTGPLRDRGAIGRADMQDFVNAKTVTATTRLAAFCDWRARCGVRCANESCAAGAAFPRSIRASQQGSVIG